MDEHRQGCEALGGYGQGVGPCTCGAEPTGWIITHEATGRVLHFSKHDGWTLDVVTTSE